MELSTIEGGIQPPFQQTGADCFIEEKDEELQLQWAAIEKLPTFKRLRTSMFGIDHDPGSSGMEFKGKRTTDVTKLRTVDRHLFIQKLIKHIENDNLRLLQKLRDRIDRVNVKLPTVEVRYKNLSVEVKCEVVQGKPLPTLWNSLMSQLSVFKKVIRCNSQEANISILKDVSGIIKPSRLTLLLGPPGSGKTTLLLALAGKLDQSLNVAGEISYNGYKLDEFVPQKSSAYISQYDLHIPEMTVRETIDFSARCQGVGSRADIMMEVSRKEKAAGIVPDPDVDTYMKAIAVEGQKRNLQTDYVLKILGLDICSDIMVGDALERGISGGQKKRLTTGEMIVGPEVGRFFSQFLLLFALHLASTSMCRFIASIFQTMVTASTCGALILMTLFLFGGFIIPKTSLPPWLSWGFWLSPMTYAQIGIALNEFLAPRWQKEISKGNTTIGREVLTSHGLNFESYFYWISLGALLGFTILFDAGFVLALTYLPAPKMSRAIISKKSISQIQEKNGSRSSTQLDNRSTLGTFSKATEETKSSGMLVLPFEPLTIAFKDVQYFVDMPLEMRKKGFNQKRLQLLRDITGAFRPGILTALMGVSGAGKTTLMDVLSGRKTGGIIEGDIRIGGYPKIQSTFARISGYCEQNDIHSPQITVKESVTYSAWLRLPPEIDPETKARFVEEVIETIELDDIKDFLVGIPGQSGLSTEQRKRLTIAVELVSNPSIIFMDEPTSGLDARAAAIVMRAVKNVVATGRTTVCTIHQPSIDVFENFDELILMKIGGQIIYSGMLGHRSSKLIEYFEGISGVPKIKNNYNPATWMLEFTSASVEAEIGLDFAKIYKESPLYRDTIELVQQLSEPQPGSSDLQFPSRFPQSGWVQFIACLWKQHLSYWRSPEYNLARFVFVIAAALVFGAVFWQKGKEIKTEQDLFNILGSMYSAVIFLGLNNCSSVLPYVETERTVLYREKFAGMYSSKAYTFAQMAIEIPYVLLETVFYVAITYPTIGYQWSIYKLFWYFYATFCTLLYFVYLGMLIVSLSTNVEVASILATAVYTILNLFSGFLMPGPKIPKWWVWCYWICPTSWSLNGLLTSQYGDMNTEILIFGELKTISSFIKDYYGFQHDRLGLVAFVLIAYPVIYASLFAYCIGKVNFQSR
ncbi:hypothetical protein I3843_02G058000 [Carya illinoinensis]|uniref:ABC transporter domain-containing protein n=1 Tax=Carya illinoinensis TaxID=32201 RepID=A0A922FPP7_CARIL|nr:hypothetical protein I3760_02G071300 [Carya illinoinensis]KAG6726196.1 hypothetical protein I3842_02G069600 [Carya illinoinensis]KAG7991078.1 hypothetical protein I3843_02G058000 [Carya illinoinensis]